VLAAYADQAKNLAPFYRGLLAEIEAHGDAEGAEAQAKDAALALGGLKTG
jgi:hypothetical protein